MIFLSYQIVINAKAIDNYGKGQLNLENQAIQLKTWPNKKLYVGEKK